MHLEQLELKGFKSFRDKAVLEFPEKFTAIVGPNGSGKSNITEAVCFVMGKSRGLRAANLQELIYNGGVSDKPAKKAVVKMTLRDDAGKEVRIARMVDQEGTSVYHLNGEKTTRQKIVDLMGESEYNIILQDDVTKVIDMRPKERRTIIDDLCGIAEYDKKKNQAVKELEKVEKRISDTTLVLGEREGYLSDLGAERDQALKFKNLQEELRTYKASMLAWEIGSLERKRERIAEKLKELEEEKKKSAERQQEIKDRITEKNRELREVGAEIFKLEEEKQGVKLTEVRGELNLATERLESVKRRWIEAENGRKHKEDVLSEVSRELADIDEMLADLTGQQKEVEAQIQEEEKNAASPEIEKKVDEAKSRVYELQSALGSAKGVAASAAEKKESLMEELDSVSERLADIGSRVEELANNIESSTVENQADWKRFENLKSELSQINREHLKVQAKLEDAQVAHARKKSELETMEKTSGGVGAAVKAILSIREVLPGIHDTVANLGRVADKKYETSLQVAAGGRMNFIVVENEEAAAKCIDYLRKKKIGRATFLPLNKVKVDTASHVPKGALGFARDYIKTDKKYRDVFGFVFGDTLVVDDLDAAKSIGIGEARMVTIDGDLAEKSGAMSGGHIQKIALSFSSTKDLEGEVASLAKTVADLEERRRTLAERRVEVESEIDSLERETSRGKGEHERMKLTRESLDEKKKELAARKKAIESQIKEAGKAKAKAEKDVAETTEKLSGAEENLKKLLIERGESSSGLLEGLKDRLRDIQVESSRLSEKKQLLAERKATLEADIKEREAQEKAFDAECADTSKKVADLKEEFESIEKSSSSVLAKIESVVSRRESIEADIEELGTELGSLGHHMESAAETVQKSMVEDAKVEQRLSDLQREFQGYEGLDVYEDKSMREMEETAAKLEVDLASFGSVNLRAIESFDVVKKEVEETKDKLETLKEERQSIFTFMEKVERRKREVFLDAFERVKKHFEDIFAEMSEGEGTLILDNPRDISESGLLIKASPGGKKIMSLDAMSGGEKTLTSAAFLLAIQRYKPAHFYVVDELDAALDKTNSRMLAELLANQSAQFLLVTHNDAVMKHATSIIGVAMNEGVSKIVGVKLT